MKRVLFYYQQDPQLQVNNDVEAQDETHGKQKVRKIPIKNGYYCLIAVVTVLFAGLIVDSIFKDNLKIEENKGYYFVLYTIYFCSWRY